MVCEHISEQAKEQIAEQRVRDEDLLLKLIDSDPRASIATLALKMGWKLYSGEPHKTKAVRCLTTLKNAKLIKQTRTGRYRLTPEGKAAMAGEE